MRFVSVMLVSLLSLAAKGASGQGGSLEKFPSKLLDRKVRIAVHVPSDAALARWKTAHPDWHPRLVLFLPGAYDGPKDLLKRGVYGDLAAREESGELAPSLWVAPDHLTSWYADREDGSFPYERFLMEELLPALERAHPGYGGSKEARTVAGLSMGAFGALNLSNRTTAFSRCVALSPALVRPPFQSAGFWIRPTLRRTFPLDQEAFAPWDPWRHLGGETALVLGCGTEDKYGLEKMTKAFAEKCRAGGHAPVAMLLAPGNHDWAFWAPTFEKLAPWIAGEELPSTLKP
ncbi:MAG TPA: alpha/beta hydrolase-fold protein [Holophagaceae bacterium]|jgi:enterochelin esterase-like enzyme|nr:alpha/beta hydrolase-fold protein [Holophagaceae bacterium]